MKTSKRVRNRKHSAGFYLFFIPVLLWILFFFVLPQIGLMVLSLQGNDYYGEMGFTLKNYTNFFQERVYWLTYVRTAVISLIVTFITMVIALPVAFYISKIAKPKNKGFLMMMALVPFWVSGLVRIYGIMTLLRESGVINRIFLNMGLLQEPLQMLFNDRAIIFTFVYTNILFMLVPIIGVMDTLDDSLIEAAYDLGAKKLVIWRQIILPHCISGITSGCIVVFMLVTGSYVTPTLIGGKNSLWFTQQIYNQFIHYFNWNQGAAFGFLLLVISSMVVWAFLKITRQKLSEVMEK